MQVNIFDDFARIKTILSASKPAEYLLVGNGRLKRPFIALESSVNKCLTCTVPQKKCSLIARKRKEVDS